MKNPLFWKNSTYGRVVWDSNKDIQEIHAEDIYCTHGCVQDSFGNTRYSIIFSCGCKEIQISQGDQSLLWMPDKVDSSRSWEVIT